MYIKFQYFAFEKLAAVSIAVILHLCIWIIHVGSQSKGSQVYED